jgi:hypothetical protein
MQITFVKTVENTQKLDKELRALTSKYQYLTQKGEHLILTFEPALIQIEVNSVSSLVNNFVEVCIVSLLNEYMSSKVFPFISKMKTKILAENISMGITQLGKTADVLGFFCTPVLLPNCLHAVSLKQTLDEGSLTVTVQLLDHYIANPDLYSTLSPFITTTRLNSMKSEIVAFLQVAPY